MRRKVAWNAGSLIARTACAVMWVVLMDMLFLSIVRNGAGFSVI